VTDEPGDEGADGFQDGADKERLPTTDRLDEVQSRNGADDGNTPKDSLD
jgi:hypothetical protein